MFLNQKRGRYDLQKQILWQKGTGFLQFYNYQMEILLGDINANLEKEDVFMPTIGNQILH